MPPCELILITMALVGRYVALFRPVYIFLVLSIVLLLQLLVNATSDPNLDDPSKHFTYE